MGKTMTLDDRIAMARRLSQEAETPEQRERFLEEWLGLSDTRMMSKSHSRAYALASYEALTIILYGEDT